MPEDLPLVKADKARLIQILTNLISNAYKYTPNGGRIAIEVSRQSAIQPPSTVAMWKPVRADGEGQTNSAGYLVCAVQDTGVGISSEDQVKLFTKFFRSGDPAVRDQPGTGLGLSITRSLIELQGGAIWVESEVGAGSTFAFSVPIAENGGS